MIARRLMVLAILALPVSAEAQRGGGNTGAPPVKDVSKTPRSDRANYTPDVNVPLTISDKDVESLSPVKVFLDKKKAKPLALTDDQLKQLKDMDASLETQNDTLFKKLDSLRKEARVNRNATNPTVEQLRVRSARTAMVEVVQAIRANYDKAEPGALGVLSEAQQKTGSELLDKHQQEAADMLQEKLGGGKRGP
jgi:hypothetical protein